MSSSSLQKYLSEWMTTDSENLEGGEKYNKDARMDMDTGLGICGRNNSTVQERQHQQQHPSLPAASSSASSVDAVHGKRDDRKNKNGSSNTLSKPKPHHQTSLPETPLVRQNHSQQQQQQRQQQGDFNTGATTMKKNPIMNTPTTNFHSTTTTENSTAAVVLSPFSSVFRRRALPISKTATATSDSNTNTATITDPLQNPDWRNNLSLDQSRVVSVVVYVTNPPPSSSSSSQQQLQQEQSLGRSASGRKKKSSTSDNDLQQQQQQHIPCVFPFDRLHKVPRSPPPNNNNGTAADGTASPTLACFQGISTTRDLVIVNPTAFGERLPNDVNMEIIRQVAFASAKNHNDTNGNGYTTEDWARIFRFNQVLWPDHNDTNNNAASDTLGGGGGGAPTITNDGTTRGLDNLVQAAVNDMIRPASISTRTFVAVSQSGLHAAANSNNNLTSSSNNSTTNMSSSASIMSATTVSSVSSKSLLLSSSNPHQVKTLHIFGSIILKSVVQSFATSSLLQQHHSTADILSTYGMLGLTVHKLLSSAASATHTVMLSLLEITPEDTIHDLLWLRSRPLLTSPPPASAAAASGAAQSQTSSSPTRLSSGKSNSNTTPQRPTKMQDSNRVNLRYSGSSSSHTSAPGGGPTLEGLEQIPIDSLKSMGHAVRRAFIMSRHLPSNAKGKRRGHVVAMIRLLPINNNNNNSGTAGSSLLLDNSTCKPPIIQFVDVAVPSTSSSSSSSSFGKPQHTTTSSSHNTSQSNGSIRRDASIRKATSALHGVLRGLLLRGAGNNVILPFRDSLLTKVLQRSVDRPDVRVCVLTGVSTLTVDYEDSMASLRFASRLLERPGEMPKSPFDTLSRTTTTCSPESSQTSSDEDDFDESSSSGEDGDNGHRDGRRRRRGLHLSHWDPPLHETIVRNITSDPRQRFSKAGVTGTTKRRKQRRPYQHQQQFLESSDSREVEISQSNSPYHVFEVQHDLPAPVETATMTMTTTTTTTSTREEMERRLQRLQQVAGRSRFSSSSSRPVLPTTMAQQAENHLAEATAEHNLDLQMDRHAQRQQEHADGGNDAISAMSARGQTDTTREPPVLTIPATNDFLSQSQSAMETPIARNSGFRSGLQDYNGRHEQDVSNYAQTHLHLQQQQEQHDTSDAVDVDWSSPSRPTIDPRFGDNHHGEANEYFLDDEPSPLTADTFGMSSVLADRFGAATRASSPPSTHQFHNRDEDDGGFIPLNLHHDNGRSDMVESVNEEIELYDNEREYIIESRERQQDRRPFGHVQTTSTITEEEEGIVTALQQQATVSTTATEQFSDSAEAVTASDEHVATDVENYRNAHQINNNMITHTVQPEAAMFSSVTGLGQRLHHMSLQSGQDEKDDDEDDGNVDPKLLDDLSYELKLRAEFATTDVGDDYNDEYPLPTKEAMDDLSIELFSNPRDGSYQDTHDLYPDFTPAARETHDARIVSKADSTAAVASTILADDGSSRIPLSKEDGASTTSSVDRLRKLSWQRSEEEQGGSARAAGDEPAGSGTNTNTRRRLSGIQPPSASPYRRAHGRDRDSLGRDAVSWTTQDGRMSAMLSPMQQQQERHENSEFVPRHDYDRSEDEHADDSRLRSKHPLQDGNSRSSPRLKDPPARSAQTDTINHLESKRHEIEPHEDAQQPAPRHHPGSFDNIAPYLAVLNRATSGSSTESFNLRSTSSREQAPSNAWDDGESHGDSSRNTEHEIQDLTAAIVRVKAQNQQSSMSINQEIQHIERSQDTVIRKLTAERDMAKREIDRRTEVQRQETMRLEEELNEVRRQLENSNAQAAEFEQLAEAAVEGREGLESTVRDLRAALSDSVHVDEYHELQEEKEQLAQSLHEAKKQVIERNSELNDAKLALKEFETEIQSWQKEKNHLLERLSTLTESTEHLQGEIYQLQTERSALRAKVDRTSKEGTALEVQLAESEENFRNARHEKQQLDKQVRDDFESFTKSITQYREKQKEMLREKADHQAVLASAQTKLDDALVELDQLRASADKERNKLQGELDNFVSNLQIVTGELKIVVAQRDEARSELERISGILNAAMAERDEALSELDATNSAKENAEQRVSVLKDECRDMQATIGRRIQILQEGRNRDIEELHILQRIVEEQTVNMERLKEDRRRAQEELHDVQQTNERLNRAFQKARQERDDARGSLQLRQQEQPHPEVFGRTSGGFRNVRSANDNAHIDRIAHHQDGSRVSEGEFDQMARHSSSRPSPRNEGDNSSIILRQETPMTRNENNGNPHEIIRQYEEIMARVRDALREHRNTGSAGDENIWTRLHSLEQMVHAHCLSTGSRMHLIEQQQQQHDQHRHQRRLADSRR